MYPLICTVLDQYCLCCWTVPYVPVDMHCVRSVLLCATVILSDLQCARSVCILCLHILQLGMQTDRHVLVTSFENFIKLCA